MEEQLVPSEDSMEQTASEEDGNYDSVGKGAPNAAWDPKFKCPESM